MTKRRTDVLLVSEDPEFVVRANNELSGVGVRVTACLGPAHSSCLIDADGYCSLARNASAAIVDSPASGRFQCHWRSIPSGVYAERLARTHPDTFVLLAGADRGNPGRCGEVATTGSRDDALELILLMAGNSGKAHVSDLKGGRREGVGS